MNKIKDNLLLIFAIIIMIVVFLLGKQYGNSSKTNLKPITDTLIYHKVDTIFAKDTVVKYALKLKFRVDTIIKPIYLDSTTYNRVYVYEDSIKTKDYTLYRKSHVQGRLRFDTTGVKLNVPLRIYDTTRITIIKDTIITTKHEIKVGVLSGFKTLAPIVEYRNNRITYGLGYDPFAKTAYVKLSYTVFRK